MREWKRGSIGAAVGLAVVLGAPSCARAQASDRAPLARPLAGEASNAFSRDPAFPLEPLPGVLQGSAPNTAPPPGSREIRKIAIVPGATPAVPGPPPAALPARGVQAEALASSPAPERRRKSPRQTPPSPNAGAVAIEPGPEVVAEDIARRAPPPRAVVVRAPPPTVILAEPPATMVQPLSPTGSGFWYFYDQPTERGSPGRR